ncbi:kinesin-like protein Klp5 [Phlyctochytrium planicorne]|nr:kinesin-like protein Klp5 [Phlyctochytrium planicorne]
MSNITVAVRVRPLHIAGRLEIPSEGKSDDPKKSLRRIAAVLDERVLIFGLRSELNPRLIFAADPLDKEQAAAQKRYQHGARRNKEVKYAFDKVFGEGSTQQEVFEGTTKPLIDDVLDGYNATVFAYGATGCGKTFTITGTEEDPGIIFRTMRELFRRIDSNSEELDTDVSLSYLEVYNETIRDLMNMETSATLDVREDDTRVVVAGLSEHRPKNVDDVMQMLIKGNENRTRAPTEANEVSSRSHAILQIHVKQKQKTSAISEVYRIATFSIIDLAGSERASATKNKGERLIEGANINRSLLALGNCINALCENKLNHIPYRGNCKVVMIANISPALMHYEETHNTLKYANRAKNIKTKFTQNSLLVDNHISQYPRIIDELRAEVDQLKEKLSAQKQEEETTPITVKHPEILDDIINRVRTHHEKIKEKSRQQVVADLDVKQNERKLSFLKSLLASMPESDTATIAESSTVLQFYLQYRQGVLDAMDHLHEQNVALRHNSGEATVAIDRHRAGIERLINTGPTARRLSQEMKERLHLESTMLQLATENDRLCTCLRVQSDHADWNTLVTEEIAKFYARNVISVYESISMAEKRSDATEIRRQAELLQISAQVLSLVVGKGEVTTDTNDSEEMIVEKFQQVEPIPVIYDTASESESDFGETDMSEAESGHADDDLDGAWNEVLPSFTKAPLAAPSIPGNAAEPAEVPAVSTVKRRTAKKIVMASVLEDSEGDDGSNTPTKPKTRSRRTTSTDPGRTPVARKAKGRIGGKDIAARMAEVSESDEQMDEASGADHFGEETPKVHISRGRTGKFISKKVAELMGTRNEGDDHSLDDSEVILTPSKTRSGKFTTRAATATAAVSVAKATAAESVSGLPPLAPRPSTSQKDSTETAKENMSIDESEDDGAGTKRLRRRHARQSFIPKIRMTPLRPAPDATQLNMTVPSKLAARSAEEHSLKRVLEASEPAQEPPKKATRRTTRMQ